MPDLTHEQRLWTAETQRIGGVDEAGRGPLAGPVFAAVVVLPDIHKPWGGLPEQIGSRLNDSKKVLPPVRAELAAALPSYVLFGVGVASVEEIDHLNIFQASLLAMKRAVEALPEVPHALLVDGKHVPKGLSCKAYPLVEGDGLSLSIAAASIMAKVKRDEHMVQLAQEHPGYGWEQNKGYATRDHRAALQRLGPTVHHRKSFSPVGNLFTRS